MYCPRTGCASPGWTNEVSAILARSDAHAPHVYGLSQPLGYGLGYPRTGKATQGATMGPTRRLTLREAAEVLGVSKEAIRKRVLRGTLPSDTGEDGRRYVYIDAGGDVADDVSAPDARDQLIAQLRSEVEAWREESR